MLFFTVLIAYLFVQWWGSGALFHKDEWFERWCAWAEGQERLRRTPGAVLAASLGGPVLVALLVLAGVRAINYWLQLVVAVPLVLYSLGRGPYTRHILAYLEAWRAGDTATAADCIAQLRPPAADPGAGSSVDAWPGLHRQLLAVAAYCGFERVFAVMFWLVVLGPAGALLYRLSVLYLERHSYQDRDQDRPQAERWLWLMEWPAVRAVGLTYAVTGNFVGCIHSWTAHLWARERSTTEVLVTYLEGALGLEEDRLRSDELTEREFMAVLSLHRRTLIFWMCLIALATLFF